MDEGWALAEFEFQFEGCLVSFEDGPKSYSELQELLPASPPHPSIQLRCYCDSKEFGVFLVEDEESFRRAVETRGKKITLMLRHERVGGC